MSGIKMTLLLSYGPKREVTVAYAPGGDTGKPMLRIANRLLLESGFTVGSKAEIQYGNGVITITKLDEQKYAYQKPSPFSPAISERALVSSAS